MTAQEERLYSNIETTNSKQIATLKKHFPECFDKEGAFIQEKMLELVSAGEVDVSRESYGLNWLGKSYARLLTNLPPKTLMRGVVEHNELPININSKHLLIKGDNLEVLKHMASAYSEKVKMIYTDPLYNTGKDGFTYRDSYTFTSDQLCKLTGIEPEEADRILKFTSKGSNSHSAWLTFMYPRLYVARELLTDDGVIYISIDENEVAQLKILCDEIFGEDNHIGTVIWKNATDNNPTNIAIEHEYIVAYAKSLSCLEPKWTSKASDIKDILVKVGTKLNASHTDEKILQSAYTKWFRANKFQLGPLDRYKFIDRDGIYTGSQSVHNPGTEGYRYDVIHPVTGKPCTEPLRGYRFPEATMKKLVKHDKILYGKSHEKIVELKLYASQFLDKFSGILALDGRIGPGELTELFPEMKTAFTNPKPTQLMEQLISFSTNGGGIILDLFSGSGTTAHAVLNLNAQDEGIYEFVAIQLDEKIEDSSELLENGYESIFDLTKERLSRVCKRSPKSGGFKVYETVNDERVVVTDDLTLVNLTMFDDELLSDEQYSALLTTWSLYDGSLLTAPIATVLLDDYSAHCCDGRLYLIAPGFSSGALKALLIKIDQDPSFTPNKVIFYGNNFESAKQMELNEALKSYANKKSIELDIVARY
jgi:adenine-specific DNA-methyltransferase